MKTSKGISFISTSQGGRRHDLERLMSSVLDFENCEFIFVDQNLALNDFVPSFFSDAKIDFVHVKCNEKISLSKARNIGIENATKEFVVFCDDDAKYEGTFNHDVQALFESHNKDTVFIVKVLEVETGLPYGNRKYPKLEKILSIHEIMHLGLSLSILIRKTLLQKINGFDEELGVGTGMGCGEESDLLLRCLAEKGDIIFTPSIFISHPAFDNSNEKNLSKVKSYAKGYGYVCTKKNASLHLQFFLRLHYLNILSRTVTGMIISPNRKIYYNRLLGLIDGCFARKNN